MAKKQEDAGSVVVSITAHEGPVAVFADEGRTRLEVHAGETITVDSRDIAIEPARVAWREAPEEE